MTRYNRKATTTNRAVTHEGGLGYKYDAEHELIALLATGIDNSFYESMKDRSDRLSQVIDTLVSKGKTEFVAKALVYARAKLGQRTVTHAGSVSLVRHLSGNPIGKHLFSKWNRKDGYGGVIYRLDDMLEMVACYMTLNPNKRLPNAMTKGFKSALESADKYELAKYQASNRSVSMVDLFNLVHPKPTTEGQAKMFKQLMTGELKQFNTAEDRNTKAGQEVAAKVKAGEITQEEADVELKEAKTDNFKELLTSKKLGYKSLVMNLRNILKLEDAETVKLAIEMLTNQKAIRNSLIQPLEIDVAAEILIAESVGKSVQRTKVLKALDDAYQLSIPNMAEVFGTGNTAIVYDTSGSMSASWDGIALSTKRGGPKTTKPPVDKATLMAATFAKGVGSDVYHFATECKQVPYNPNDTFSSLISTFKRQQGKVGHGTNFQSIVDKLSTKYYDRVIVISDMQSHTRWDISEFQGMPYIYSIDICGYGTTMTNPRNPRMFQLFGYSAEMIRLVTQQEIDPKALMKEINAIRLY